jgi:hypothetical protein
MNQTVDSIDAMLENFDTKFSMTEEAADRKPITLWVPLEYGHKYEELQRRSKRKFGKLLKAIFMSSIDKVKIED